MSDEKVHIYVLGNSFFSQKTLCGTTLLSTKKFPVEFDDVKLNKFTSHDWCLTCVGIYKNQSRWHPASKKTE